MTKNILEDMVVRRKPVVNKNIKLVKKRIEKIPTKPTRTKRQSSGVFRLIFRFLIVAVIAFVVLMGVNLFSSVTVKLTPKQEFVTINTGFRAQQSGVGVLPFEIMQINYEESKLVSSTGKEKTSGKASGRIVIYNSFSSQPQILVKNTRFETPDGKIYRIKSAITVPGAKVTDGKIVPSSIEATVYADQFGEEYDIGLTDFTIPGFKGGPRYEKFYARSKTEMVGGFDGVVAVVTDEDLSRVREETRKKIEAYFTENAEKQVPEEFLLYGDDSTVEFVESESNPKAGDRVESFEYKQEGRAVYFLIKESDLSKEIVSKYVGDNEDKITVVNMKDLEFDLLERDNDNKNILFNINGRGHLVWDINIDVLYGDLRQSDKGDYNSVFKKYVGVEKAEIVFKYSWWRVIPKKESKVNFETILLEE